MNTKHGTVGEIVLPKALIFYSYFHSKKMLNLGSKKNDDISHRFVKTEKKELRLHLDILIFGRGRAFTFALNPIHLMQMTEETN